MVVVIGMVRDLILKSPNLFLEVVEMAAVAETVESVHFLLQGLTQHFVVDDLSIYYHRFLLLTINHHTHHSNNDNEQPNRQSETVHVE